MLEKIKEVAKQMLDGDLEASLPLIDLLTEAGYVSAADELVGALMELKENRDNTLARLEQRSYRSVEERNYRLNEFNYEAWCGFVNNAHRALRPVFEGPPDLSFVKELGVSLEATKQTERLAAEGVDPEPESMREEVAMAMARSRNIKGLSTSLKGMMKS